MTPTQSDKTSAAPGRPRFAFGARGARRVAGAAGADRTRPSVRELFLYATILLAGLVSLPQDIPAGPVTSLGAATVLGSCAAWVLWFVRPRLAREHVALLLPLLMFGIYAAGTALWVPVTVKGLQLLCVLVGFVGLVLLTAREVEEKPDLAGRLQRALDAATWFATAVYAFSVARDGLGADSIILARPYALFVLLGLARQLALWQSGDNRGLLGAAVIFAVLLGSISRTALAAALLMVPLTGVVRGGARGAALAVGSVVAGGLALAAALALSDTIYDRFFGFDSTMQVGGVWVNASGRTAMWARLWESAMREPLLGHGVASSSLLIDQHFPGLGHPHNDYLRFFHDFGVVGLALWLAFHVGATVVLFLRARAGAAVASRATDAKGPTPADGATHLVPLLGLVALGVTMFTDNTVSYQFVMAPLAIFVGCSLGRSAVERRTNAATNAAGAARAHAPSRRGAPGVRHGAVGRASWQRARAAAPTRGNA